jgi:hypothetical protein
VKERVIAGTVVADRRQAPVISPYARYNLRRNPFGELTREERAELAVVEVERWVDLLGDQGRAVQFMGQAGDGKTTHLLALQRSLPGAVYAYLPEDGPHPPIPLRRPLLIDEAQRLSRGQRGRIFVFGGPLVLGTHADLSRELRQAGLAVVTYNVGADRSPRQLARILNARIEASRLSDSPVPRIDAAHAARLLANVRHSIRDIEQLLYDDFQTAVQNGMPWPTAN